MADIKSLDLTALSTIEEEVVEVNGQQITVTMLVPEDVEKCRKLIMRKKLDESLAMEYLTFLAVKKAHPEITWYVFQSFNFRVVNMLMACMALQNGFTETFRVFGGAEGGTGFSGSGSGEGAGQSQNEYQDDGLDFD